MKSRKREIYRRYIKRPMDLVLSLLALIVLSPLLFVVAIIVKLKLGNPIIFKQQRPGLNEKIFTMYKFRTMTNKCDVNGNLEPDCDRLTKLGRFLRSTSIDELPELINVIKNDMSLIGPRPLLIQYLPLYNETQRKRHEVRPGLSGLAQLNGRNGICWDNKFDLDIEYINNIKFTRDISIILKTLTKVVLREGICSANLETMEMFTGNIKEE